MSAARRQQRKTSAGELPQEFLFVHVILEGLAAVDEYDWNFIVELPAEFKVRVDIDFAPGESSATRKLGKALLHHFTEVASLAGVDDDAALIAHFARILA